MATFSYVARDHQGNLVKGTTEAQSQNMVARMLREQGMIPTSIEAGSEGASAAKARRRAQGKGGAVKLEDLVILTRQFATMIRAGLPLIEVLNILGDQCEKRQLKLVMKQIERDVETGSSLGEALGKHPKIFNNF